MVALLEEHYKRRTPRGLGHVNAGPRFRFVLLVTAGLTAAALTSAPVAATAARSCRGKEATIVGTARADLLKGTARRDVIVGLGGNDTIKGRDDSDWICGGKGNDTLFGGGDRDGLWGDEGNDELNGGGGFENFLAGGPGGDALNGDGSHGDLALYGEAPGSVTVDLAAGTAVGDGSDTLANIENVAGSNHDDTLIGNAGPNALFAEQGNDTLSGGDGDDSLFGRGGDDAFDGGSGEDLVQFDAQSGVTVNLTNGTATGEGSDTLANIEDIVGSRHDDMLTGDAGPNKLSGSNGNDTLFGGDGDDTLTGDPGTDSLDGGNGTDSCDGETEVNCEA